MAKIGKRTIKRRLTPFGVATFLLTFCAILSFVTNIFVHTNTAKLVREIEKNRIVVDKLTQEKEVLVREVNALGDYANIVEKVESFGLEHFIDNYYFVNKGE